MFKCDQDSKLSVSNNRELDSACLTWFETCFTNILLIHVWCQQNPCRFSFDYGKCWVQRCISQGSYLRSRVDRIWAADVQASCTWFTSMSQDIQKATLEVCNPRNVGHLKQCWQCCWSFKSESNHNKASSRAPTCSDFNLSCKPKRIISESQLEGLNTFVSCLRLMVLTLRGSSDLITISSSAATRQPAFKQKNWNLMTSSSFESVPNSIILWSHPQGSARLQCDAVICFLSSPIGKSCTGELPCVMREAVEFPSRQLLLVTGETCRSDMKIQVSKRANKLRC